MSVDRKENFIRLAEARTNKILKYVNLLGNLSNKSYYNYSEEQVNAIFSAIQNELEEQRERFGHNDEKQKKFRL